LKSLAKYDETMKKTASSEGNKPTSRSLNWPRAAGDDNLPQWIKEVLHYLLDFCCNEERACRTSAAKLCRSWVEVASNWNQQCCVCVCVSDSLSTNAIPTYTELHEISMNIKSVHATSVGALLWLCLGMCEEFNDFWEGEDERDPHQR
jgi:hypothetical protein